MYPHKKEWISSAITAQLICAFVFTFISYIVCKSHVSFDAAHIVFQTSKKVINDAI